MKTTTFLAAAAVLFLGLSDAGADEQNGLSVNVSRKTTDQSQSDGGKKTRVRLGLKVEIKNQRLKPIPAGELQWTVLVRRSSSETEMHKGKEVLKALAASESVELTFGDFKLGTVREYETVSKDTLEYELVIRHEGKESYRFATKSGFAELAKRATLIERKSKEEREQARLDAEVAAMAAVEKKLEADPGRLSMNISRLTLETRGPERDPEGEGMVTRRRQTLKLELKNIGIKPLPAGEIRWCVIVKGRGNTKYEGVTPVKPLRSSEAISVQVGSFNVVSRKTESDVSKADVEYRVVVVHDEKETARFSTTAEFSALAKSAEPAEKKEDGKGDVVVADAGVEKKPVAPAVAGTPGAMPPPVSPGAGAPKQPMVEEPVINRAPVDFFNLGKKP